MLRGHGRHARLHDGSFFLRTKVVERGHHIPAVQLRMVKPLRAEIQAIEVALANGVAGGKQAKLRMRMDDPVLVEQGELPVALEHALDDEHHIGPSGVVFIKNQGHRPLQSPGHDAFLKLGDLPAFAQHHRIATDQVQAADMAV